MDDTVLLTGATGFIGSHLATRLIQKGQRARCLVRSASPKIALEYLSGLGADLVYGDLTDRTSLDRAVEGAQTVFHLGGGGTLGMPEQVCFKINVDGTRNLLEACADQGTLRRFVHVSTCGVMGDIKTPPADETYLCHPENYTYARAKAAAEEVVRGYADRIPATVIRFPMVYGPPLFKDRPERIAGVSPTLLILSMVKRGRWVYIGDGTTLTHWVYVDDVVRGLELAARKGERGEVYILGDRTWGTFKDFVETAARTVHAEMPRRHLPVPVARFLATLAEVGAGLLGRTPRLTRWMVDAFLVNRAFDISKAQRELGFEPKMSLEEGLQRTAQWYEENGYLGLASAACGSSVSSKPSVVTDRDKGRSASRRVCATKSPPGRWHSCWSDCSTCSGSEPLLHGWNGNAH